MRRLFWMLFVIAFACANQILAQHAKTKTACTGGMAGEFPCEGMDLLARMSGQDLGAEQLNDIWGWTSPRTGQEIALVGGNRGVAFVDVTVPTAPVFLGYLPSQEGRGDIWRDIKVYADHAFVVADGRTRNGMQVFDLAQLETITSPPVTFEATAHYDGVITSHNIAINEETGFAYLTGTNTCRGLHIVNIQDPANPVFTGCFQDERTGRSGDGYTHDVQCVIYRGPDTLYQGREICFGSNETALSIADVTDKDNPEAIAIGTYPSVSYAHQGWLTDDHKYFIMNDELDERAGGLSETQTLIWDVVELDDPLILPPFKNPAGSIDHNLYVVGDYVYQANYSSGLRILDFSDVARPYEVAYFDTLPEHNNLTYAGVWSVYPFFDSGTLIVSDLYGGLFLLEATSFSVILDRESETQVPEEFVLSAAYPNPFNPSTEFTVTLPQAQFVEVAAYDVSGRIVAELHKGHLPVGEHPLRFDAGHLPSGTYIIRATGNQFTRTATVVLAK